MPPTYEIEGQVFFADGFNLTIDAPDEDAARRIAGNRVHASVWLSPEIHEVCIQSVTEKPPSTPPSLALGTFPLDLGPSDVATLSLLLELEYENRIALARREQFAGEAIQQGRAAGNHIDAAFLSLRDKFRGIVNDSKKERNPMNVENNPWQLYTTQTGWRDCAHRLDHAMSIALAALDGQVADGHTLAAAAVKAHAWMVVVMCEARNAAMGAYDSEPLYRMERLICAHVKARYGVVVEL